MLLCEQCTEYPAPIYKGTEELCKACVTANSEHKVSVLGHYWPAMFDPGELEYKEQL